MTELKPCPFCGAAASAWEWNGGARVDCSKWRADAYSVYTHYVGIGARTMEEAIELWNRRAEQPPAQPEPLTDKEQRIFLAAMGREEKVCKKVDEEDEECEISLVHICHEIIRKVKDVLWA